MTTYSTSAVETTMILKKNRAKYLFIEKEHDSLGYNIIELHQDNSVFLFCLQLLRKGYELDGIGPSLYAIFHLTQNHLGFIKFFSTNTLSVSCPNEYHHPFSHSPSSPSLHNQ